MTGGAPCASSSHSTGRAKNSPSLSRPVISASTTGGKVPGVDAAVCAGALDLAFGGEFAQHAVERRAVGVFRAECARDFARADIATAFADKRDQFVA